MHRTYIIIFCVCVVTSEVLEKDSPNDLLPVKAASLFYKACTNAGTYINDDMHKLEKFVGYTNGWCRFREIISNIHFGLSEYIITFYVVLSTHMQIELRWKRKVSWSSYWRLTGIGRWLCEIGIRRISTGFSCVRMRWGDFQSCR